MDTRTRSPPTVGGAAAPLSESALALFKMLLVFMDDTSINFDLLLDAVTNALPALETTQDCHMKAELCELIVSDQILTSLEKELMRYIGIKQGKHGSSLSHWEENWICT
ncbi:hypothetical protein CEXT_623171 [Caerostris extrusa]|uniref:Uncharacterized protein n=1 Tax=Caerostris extrusa TaxID=172846 RepID=A0AAV4PQX6_CAEEX|nr:hypothetical protein CEXT_623171 [Caerostris extrusa]